MYYSLCLACSIRILSYFQEEMMTKEDPIKIREKEELGKEADQEICVPTR